MEVANSPCWAASFLATWDYRQSGGEETPTQRQFFQRYSLGVGPAWTYQPSHAIQASAGLTYTRTERGEVRTGRPTTRGDFDEVIPSARLSLINDIFQAYVAGNATFSSSSSGTDSSRSSWEAAIGTAYQIPLWPQVRLNYSERNELYGSSRIFEQSDYIQKDTTLSVDWNLILGQLYYQFSHSNTEDEASQSDIVDDTHFVRFETAGNFLQDRISVNFAQQFQTSSREVSIQGVGQGVLEPLDQQIFQVALTDPDFLLDPVPGDPWTDDEIGLVANVGLGDEDLDQSALSLDSDQRFHLAISVLDPIIDVVRITLSPLADDPAADALQWDLYVRDPSGTAWELAEQDIAGNYDPVVNRYDFLINLTEREVMLVAINRSNFPLEFTEVEAFGLLTEDSSGDNTSYLTNMGLRYRITQDLSASANLTLDHYESGAGETASETDRRTFSGNLRWTPSNYFMPGVSYSENLNEQSGQPDLLSRTYSLTILSYPLPVVSVTLGTNRTENFTGGERTNLSQRYNLTTRALIYPDLTAAWSLSYVKSERFAIEDSLLSAGESTAISTRLDLNAVLHRYLVADLVTSYRKVEAESGPRAGGDVTMGLQYRPSPILALRGGYTTFFGDTEREDELNLNLNLRVLNTPKTRLTLNATHIQADDSTQNLNVVANWDISRHLWFLFTGNYRIAERNVYNFVATLNFAL